MPRKAKDMRVLRETPQFRAMAKGKTSRANLKDYSMQSVVEISWDLNAEAKRDQMMKIRLNDQEAIIDLEELLHYTRLV
jgi:hypothetical protein